MQLVIESNARDIQINGLIFTQIHLIFEPGERTDLFALKNNKTLAETVSGRRYQHLADKVRESYLESVDKSLGTFLFENKREGDLFYKQFLNRYGDKAYSRFYFRDPVWSKRRGLYCFLVGKSVKYYGQSKDSFGKRINQGYGNISPKNCFQDGQATNCHVNSLITEHKAEVTLYLCEVKVSSQIDMLEKCLIQTYNPEWNIALK